MPNYINVYGKKDSFYKNGVLVDEYGNPITGIRRVTYSGTNIIRDETPFINGAKDGIQRVYDNHGKLWWENTWKKNTMVDAKMFD